MTRLPGPCLAAAFLFGCAESALAPGNSTGPDLAPATTFSSNTVIDFNFQEFVDCANGGAGEWVAFAGRLHQLQHVTLTANGHATLKTHFQPQGVSGIGLVSGKRYSGVGVSQTTETVSPVGVTQTLTNVFRLVGQGPGNNLSIHENFHVTINANGTVTSFHEHDWTSCG